MELQVSYKLHKGLNFKYNFS